VLFRSRLLDRVRRYLTRRRGLAVSLIEPLVQSGKLYADSRANAVFLLVAGKAQRPVGAELRGTGPRVWRGLAPGTRKELGYFWIGAQGSREIVLCESAIDAMSCFQMHPQRICISTSGVRADPPWLHVLLARDYELYCGFDAEQVFDIKPEKSREPAGCICGEILRGVKTPMDCRLFKKACTPEKPVGPCMVSSEGTCAAYYHYGNLTSPPLGKHH